MAPSFLITFTKKLLEELSKSTLPFMCHVQLVISGGKAARHLLLHGAVLKTLLQCEVPPSVQQSFT